jgi:hypothetical protein
MILIPGIICGYITNFLLKLFQPGYQSRMLTN